MPWIGAQWRWPWIDLSGSSLILKMSWNISLFLWFGFLHSALAQKPIQKVLERALPPQLVRTFYLCVTGLSLFWMMMNWQDTKKVIWDLHLPAGISFWVSSLIYWGLMLYCGQLLTRFGTTRFGMLEFVGLRQHRLKMQEIHRTEGTPKLITTGIYRWVRHPVYTGTLLAFLLTPEMTLDRALVVLSTVLYLIFAIPVEEKKLIRQFGDAYLEYRYRVPALIPFVGLI